MDEVTAAALTGRVQEDSRLVMDATASQVTENLLPPSPPRRVVGEHVGSPKRQFSLLPVQVTAWRRIHQLGLGAAVLQPKSINDVQHGFDWSPRTSSGLNHFLLTLRHIIWPAKWAVTGSIFHEVTHRSMNYS